MTSKKLLLVEDDRPIADLVAHHFRKEGFVVITTSNGDDALLLIEETRPDIIILDWMIEGTSGIEVCRRIRRKVSNASMPVLMLTARGDEDDRVRGLETGADDFVTKPFSPKELVARANALLRRANPSKVSVKLAYADLEMELAAHRVRRGNRPLELGPTEYRLLRHFLEHPETVYSRDQLLEAVWPHNEDIEARTVDVHIRRLRVALSPAGEPDLIRTVRSEGYSLERA